MWHCLHTFLSRVYEVLISVLPGINCSCAVVRRCLGWARVLFAEGPRVVVNTLTLVSVIRADLIPDHEEEALRHLSDHSQVQALIQGTMIFTTIFWLFTVIQLTIA